MKTIYKLLFLFAMINLIACEETIVPINKESDKLIGTWINATYVDTLMRFERGNALQNDCYGFIFKSDHSFVERKNVGWCGTPPITYGNFDGTWSRNDSLINITVDYWGGKADYQWKLISVDDHTLTIYKAKQEYRGQ